MQMLAALESIMQKEHTEGGAPFPLPYIALSPEYSFTYPQQSLALSQTQAKSTSAGGEGEHKQARREIYVCMYAFRTI